ncbi:Stealth CR1 domain-containing protein [Cronobacter turicensis]|nr:Stealth CR1 domain-containing protein [Cronobacter turicensis]
MGKIRKLLSNPQIFFRDYFNKKYPPVFNEIKCPVNEEQVLIKNDSLLESLMENNLPIDVVFTWVDDSDPLWIEKYNHYKSRDYNRTPEHFRDSARYKNHNEIFYAIKSVVRHLPWVNKIYLVTDNQSPVWIDEFRNIQVIDHKEIIDEAYLPTFNSHVIEANLHNIRGLKEHFIYFNDDVFVARDLCKSHFFKANGIASIFVSSKRIKPFKDTVRITPTLHASLNCADLLKKRFDFNAELPLTHTYVPLKKSQFEAVWDEFHADIIKFLPNRFRNELDLNLPTFLVPWFSYIQGESVLSRDICYYFNIRSSAAPAYYSRLKSARQEGTFPHSICANDFMSTSSDLKNYSGMLEDNLKILMEEL